MLTIFNIVGQFFIFKLLGHIAASLSPVDLAVVPAAIVNSAIASITRKFWSLCFDGCSSDVASVQAGQAASLVICTAATLTAQPATAIVAGVGVYIENITSRRHFLITARNGVYRTCFSATSEFSVPCRGDEESEV